MQDQRFVIESNPSEEELQFLRDRIIEHNISQTGIQDYKPLAIFVPGEQNHPIAGICGYTWGGCCEIEVLWVHADFRNSGYGRQLLKMAEAEAVNRGCHLITLNTYSFQAPDFYPKLGYTLTGVEDNNPAGHRRFYLQKRLDSQ